jgi:carbon storage regulator
MFLTHRNPVAAVWQVGYSLTDRHKQGGSAMLVLSRKLHETIRIGNDITISVVRIAGNKVRLGITAPDGVTIFREELLHGEKPIDIRTAANCSRL